MSHFSFQADKLRQAEERVAVMAEELALDLQRSAEERLQQTQALLMRAAAGAQKLGVPGADAVAAAAVARTSHADMYEIGRAHV